MCEKIKLKDWQYEGNRVKLTYYDDSVLFVDKRKFNTSTGAILNASKDVAKDEFALNYKWKDIVKIDGKLFVEEFTISGEMDTPDTFQIDDFIDMVSKKYNVEPDKIETLMCDGFVFDSKTFPGIAESCGCYINGTAEWLRD